MHIFQIELCSHHLVLNSSSCRGYLHKMGSSSSFSGKPSSGKSAFSRATWNKRWFVFDRNKRTVLYFADKQEAKVKGGIYFQVGKLRKVYLWEFWVCLFMVLIHGEVERDLETRC